MFDKTFYPTPDRVIWKMLEGLDLTGKKVLDPSAGLGHILDKVKSINSYSYSRSATTYAIEINPERRAVLIEKGHKVIDTDFLTYSGEQYFHYILANPPFDDGASHLLKMWEISKGALIRCLLNAETVENAFSQERKELKSIIERFGKVDDLGQAFKTAERPTNVHVILVTLQDTRKKEYFRLNFDPATIGGDRFEVEDLTPSELAPAYIFDNYEARHKAALEAFKELLLARQKVEYYLNPLLSDGFKSSDEVIEEAIKKHSPDQSYDEFLQLSTKLSWDTIFRKTKLADLTTQKTREKIEKVQATQGNMSFTAKNMEELFTILAGNKEHIIIECVLEVFDLLTKYHHENREHVEGWKTNSSYGVGKRFILPYIGSTEWGSRPIDYRHSQTLDDIEKALCFLSGKKIETILQIRDVYEEKANYGERMESEFFYTRLYKKGTMHFEWKDEALRQDFNRLVGIHRWGELPEKVKRGAYK